jgi:hypothetical protein
MWSGPSCVATCFSWLNNVAGIRMAAADWPATCFNKFLREITGCVFVMLLFRFIVLQENLIDGGEPLPEQIVDFCA